MFARNAPGAVQIENCSIASSTVATNGSFWGSTSYPWDIMRMIAPAHLQRYARMSEGAHAVMYI